MGLAQYFGKLGIVLCIIGCQRQTILEKKIHEEVDGIVAVEAEDYDSQELDGIRKWYEVEQYRNPMIQPDPDDNHAAAASKRIYLEVLPDTRTTHDDDLKERINFSNEPGKIAILNYKVHFSEPGRFYVWVRAYSSGTEDNSLHVGLNGNWPESGRRMQWCEGKDRWTWESKQRTEEVHCGVEKQIYLEIPGTGIHTISFSMREDGFEFDKWIMSKKYSKPNGAGPG